MRCALLPVCVLFAACLPLGAADKDDKAKALGEILVQDDDEFPDGIKADETQTDQKKAPILYRQFPKSEVFATRDLKSGDDSKGMVTAFEFTNKSALAKSYKTFAEGMGGRATKLDGVGDKSMTVTTVVDLGNQNYSITDVLFLRGNRLIHVRVLGDAPKEAAQAHAKRLDARLKEAPK